MVSDFTSKTFRSFSYFSYLGVQLFIISSLMVSDLTLKTFLSSTYFNYYGIQSTTILNKMVSVFIVGRFFFLVNLGIIEHLWKS
jgi:hypothetical protein